MKQSQRPLYSHADLRRLIEPDSIAVVGVSANPKGFGSRTVAGLDRFAGELYLVNAKYQQLDGRPCYPSLSALPQVPDCVVIATPAAAVEPIFEECAALGVGGVVLYASGFAETGKPHDVSAQATLAELAAAAGVRLLGPNCIGFLNTHGSRSLTFMGDLAIAEPSGPAVGIVSQSGALGLGLGQAAKRGTQISHILNAGNSCDVDVADLVNYLVDDAHCAAIACVFEGMAQPERFMDAAERALAANKPLVVFKVATSAQGAASAMSHTGSLAGLNEAYDAAFRRHGVVVVDQLEALVETASFFAKAPPPSAPGAAVVAASGGLAIIGADAAEAHGIALPPPSAEVAAILARHVPHFGSATNPCDVTAQVTNNPQSLLACARAFLESPDCGALVFPIHYAYEAIPARVELVGQLARECGKPVCLVWGNGWVAGPGFDEAERSPHAALFGSMDRCFKTLAAWHAREERRQRGPRRLDRLVTAAARQHAGQLIDAAPYTTLTERETKAVLSAYGLPVNREILVQGAADAVAAARECGFPVALKAESPDIAHKTEAGVIRLHVADAASVERAFDEIMLNVAALHPPPRLNGVLVQPMATAGLELVVGARVDPLFGPLVLVGFGGVLVELLKDTVIDLAPVTQTEAHVMLMRLKAAALFEGFRGAPAVDLDGLAEIVCRVSELAADHADRLTELDVNPLICTADGIVAVDALLVRREAAA